MKFLANCSAIILTCLLISCGGSNKKVLIMASGKVSVSGNKIKLEPGTTHHEELISVSGNTINVDDGKSNYDQSVAEPGLYVLNIKMDTIVGSYQRVGTENKQEVITQENLKMRIDSLDQLMKGANASAAGRNFCIVPGTIAKISSNTEAQVIGPYVKMPGSFEAGKEYEIYKFYTNKEMTEIVDKLRAMVQ